MELRDSCLSPKFTVFRRSQVQAQGFGFYLVFRASDQGFSASGLGFQISSVAAFISTRVVRDVTLQLSTRTDQDNIGTVGTKHPA